MHPEMWTQRLRWDTRRAPWPWVGLDWKSEKLSHEISPLPPDSVWAGNTMRITFLFTFQQFCFRAWAKQGSAEAWELKGDTNIWEHGLSCSKSLYAIHCFHQGSSAKVTPPSGWYLQMEMALSDFPVGQIAFRQQSSPRNSFSNCTSAKCFVHTHIQNSDAFQRHIAHGLQSTWAWRPNHQRTSVFSLLTMRHSKRAWFLDLVSQNPKSREHFRWLKLSFQCREPQTIGSSGRGWPYLPESRLFHCHLSSAPTNQTRCAHSSTYGM